MTNEASFNRASESADLLTLRKHAYIHGNFHSVMPLYNKERGFTSFSSLSRREGILFQESEGAFV